MPASKTVTAHVRGEVLPDGKEQREAQLTLTVNDIYVDESASPVRREIQTIELARVRGGTIEDGLCTVKFDFAERHYEHRMRIERGQLLGG